MFVEKLNLFGFKSFNKKVTLDFGSGISGIIGPNGCGKSNVVDAMRWVLGEQSTKQLRGTKMEDVIFNGTRSQKPLSMAEVELTLNNDRGRLSIDYSTVSVARRLYRSGASEYLINKKPVRLKDVRELFMDTGMGSHAYSVIERQMVDNILSDTTGHRRFLFEEAAGIMKYKTRKKEALSKLEATERDLLRVDDIITEVDRQVASLKRQVGKARRYRELMDEIRDMDLAFSQARRAEWLARLHEIESSYSQAMEAAESGETEVSALDARLEELHLAVLEEEKALSAARELLAQVDDDLGRTNSNILVLRERLEATRQRIGEAEDHKVRLTDRMERNRTESAEIAVRLDGVGERETRARTDLETREQSLSEVETRLGNLRNQVAEKQTEADRHRDESVRAESAVESTARRIQDVEGQIRNRSERAEGMEAGLRERRQALEGAREQVEAARAKTKEVEEDLRVLDMRRENHGSRLEVLRKGLGEKREQEAAARSRLSTLEDLRRTYEGFDPGVQALMVDENRDPGVLGTLGELIKIAPEWTTALEPVLSPVWQYVVVNETGTARRVVDRLRRDSLGYASLVCLDRVPETPDGDASLDWAADRIQTEDRYRPLVAYLLHGLALVDDLETGLRTVSEGRAPRAVTRNGHFVDGAVVAGGEGGPSGSELLEREEAIARCVSQVESLAKALEEMVIHETELKEEGSVLVEERARLEADMEKAHAARSAAEKELASRELELRHAEETRESLLEEKASLETARKELQEERSRLEDAHRESRERAESTGRTLDELKKELGEVSAVRETELAAVHELRMAWAGIESEVKESRATATRLEQEKSDLAAEWERNLRDEKEARERVVTIEEELAALAEKVQELHVLRDDRAEVVADREREKSEAASREQVDAEMLREARRTASGARQRAHELELKRNDIRSNLTHLEERLHEEYEITTQELDQIEKRELPEDTPRILAEMKERIRRLGPVNLLAMEEYDEKSRRLEFMTTQRDDLLQARDSLLKTIDQINKTASGMFLETFTQVQENFQKTFKVLFQGGECSLDLTGDDPLEADIDVLARPRGKKPQHIAQLSSGERALTAIALLFAIYLVKPSPFCILDEVDAPLDDANIDRFVNMVKEFSQRTQFIVITHNKKTMEAADCLYGITMQEPGVSSVVSVKLDGVENSEPKNGNGNQKTEDDPLSPESVIAQ